MKPRSGAGRPGKVFSRDGRSPRNRKPGSPELPAREPRPPRGKRPSRDARPEREDRQRFGKPAFGKKPPFGKPAFGKPAFGKRPPREEPRAVAPEAEAPVDNGRFIFGINPVLEALRAKSERIEQIYIADGSLNERVAGEVFTRAKQLGIRVATMERERLGYMVSGVHQGIVAEVRTFDYIELEELIAKAKGSGRQMLFVVLDGIQDPHNFGAIVRSAWAFGAHGVIIAKDRAAQVTGVVSKASAGAIEHCPIARVVNLSRALETLKAAGVWTVAADTGGDRSLWEAPLDGPMALVVGAEGDGVREGVLKHCDFKVKIPMSSGFNSLNASVSSGVMLAEIGRQRAVKLASSKA